MLRILLLAPGANPDVITGPLIGYFHGEALARLHAVTLVIRSHNEEAVRRKKPPFHAIEVITEGELLARVGLESADSFRHFSTSQLGEVLKLPGERIRHCLVYNCNRWPHLSVV